MHGLEVSAGSPAGVLSKVKVLLAPLQAGIVERTRTAGWWHCDETSWACFADPDCRPDGRKRRWWLWVAKSADATSFVAAGSRAANVLDDLLGADNTLVSGIVRSDMYAAYGCLDQLRFTRAWCWAHVRRHIIRAAKPTNSLRPWADAWLADVAVMYTAWHARRAGADDGAGLDAAISVLRARLDDEVAGAQLLVPRAAKVVEMIDSHWEGLGSPWLLWRLRTLESFLAGGVVWCSVGPLEVVGSGLRESRESGSPPPRERRHGHSLSVRDVPPGAPSRAEDELRCVEGVQALRRAVSSLSR